MYCHDFFVLVATTDLPSPPCLGRNTIQYIRSFYPVPSSNEIAPCKLTGIPLSLSFFRRSPLLQAGPPTVRIPLPYTLWFNQFTVLYGPPPGVYGQYGELYAHSRRLEKYHLELGDVAAAREVRSTMVCMLQMDSWWRSYWGYKLIETIDFTGLTGLGCLWI